MQSSKTLGDVNDIQDLVEKLDNIYVPAERMLTLDDPLLQKYIALRPDDDAGRLRLERQLEVFLDEQLEKIEGGLDTSKELSDILRRLSSNTQFSKVKTRSNLIEARLRSLDSSKPRENLLRTLSTEVGRARQPRRNPTYTILRQHSAFRRYVRTFFSSSWPISGLHLYCNHNEPTPTKIHQTCKRPS